MTVDAGPYDLQVPGTQAGAILIHGLTGTPYEVRPLAEALAARGIRARGLLLPGHGTHIDEMRGVSHGDWLAAVRAAYAEMKGEHRSVFVVGMSLGGLLSLRLAELEGVSGLVVVGTPLELAPPLPWLIPLVKHLLPLKSKGGSDIADPAARARHPSYEHMPLASVHQLIRLQSDVIRDLGRITAPTFVAHGAKDRTARPRDAQRIHDEISSEQRELCMYERSGHVVPVDYDGVHLAEHAADFLAKLVV